MKRRPGFTLLELLVTIGIIGIIAATSIPSYAAAQRRLTVNQAAAELANNLQAARTKAMSGGTDVTVVVSSGSVTSAVTSWTAPNGITLSPIGSVTFAHLSGLASSALTITVQNSGGTNRTVAIAANGKISLP